VSGVHEQASDTIGLLIGRDGELVPIEENISKRKG
jgi:hypothetical protein